MESLIFCFNNSLDAEHTYVNNTVMHNSFEPYENVDFSVSKPHTVQSNQKGAKLPVPQVRSSAPASKVKGCLFFKNFNISSLR